MTDTHKALILSWDMITGHNAPIPANLPRYNGDQEGDDDIDEGLAKAIMKATGEDELELEDQFTPFAFSRGVDSTLIEWRSVTGVYATTTIIWLKN